MTAQPSAENGLLHLLLADSATPGATASTTPDAAEHQEEASPVRSVEPDDHPRRRHVRSPNAFEETLQRLLQMVRLGVVAPGEQLPPEREFAIRLGVSRDTLRDALATLAEAGYLVSRRGRYGGTFVADQLPPDAAPAPGSPSDVSAEQLSDALGLRMILETGAAREAASRSLSAAERDGLWRALEESRAATAENYRRLDSRFHLQIAELAGIPSLVAPLADAKMRVNNLLDCLPLIGPNISHSNEQHEQLAVAILAGNPAAAEAVMREHLEGTSALLRGFFA
ncbi:FadR/GntR family transcriptional regulator [Lysinibacter cavernae]|uniref:DNA-binding FadR family transcriptional regulator n=1 Tax=Lysinibacter cavernae TaxID=1640652 RepID=A0A7X5R1H3_9MICO|nr:FCD domain-containing protein [Lysinibacter cavernae]NIH53884.1 DNA-binding FadR family transcriptional regulator [Lysinibacter cavernae]